MKNIAILIHGFTLEYSLSVLYGIEAYFKDKDVRLLIGQTQDPYSTNGHYEYQCWNIKNLLFSNEVDAIIVITGSYISVMNKEDLVEGLKDFSSKPIISIGVDLGLKNSTYTYIDCSDAYVEVVKHLIEVHNCKRIAFISADRSTSIEAAQRYEAYKNALKANGLEFDKALVFQGDFAADKTYNMLKEKFTSKEQVNFDAVLTASDGMAYECLNALEELDLKIPDDVKVIGFDNTTHAQKSNPTISTISQQIFQQGYIGAEITYDILNGKPVSHKKQIEIEPMYRQTCGCVPLGEYRSVYRNRKGEIVPDQVVFQHTNGKYYNFLSDSANIYSFLDIIKISNTMESLLYNSEYIMSVADISAMAICIYDKPISVRRNEPFVIPDKISLSMFVDRPENIKCFEPGVTFNPHEHVLPPNYFEKIKGNYLVHPIYSGELNYGYVVCALNRDTVSIYCIYLKILITAIAQAYEHTLAIFERENLHQQNMVLQLNNSDLSLQSRTDELTRILNRRGFLTLGQRTINGNNGEDGIVLFADMDKLKSINDTYGHKMGDRALKTMATVFSKSLRSTDIVGRLSGDEFAAVIPGMPNTEIKKLRTKIAENCRKFSEEMNLPFYISCSIGDVRYNKENFKLEALLKDADRQLYLEKQHKKNLKLEKRT